MNDFNVFKQTPRIHACGMGWGEISLSDAPLPPLRCPPTPASPLTQLRADGVGSRAPASAPAALSAPGPTPGGGGHAAASPLAVTLPFFQSRKKPDADTE